MRYINYSAIINYGMSYILAKKEHALRLFLRMDDCRCFIVWNIDNMGLDSLDFISKSLLIFVR